MIYLVTGVPGSGKSLRSIKMILDWLKEGRTVYADIDGLKIDGVQPSPNDWRDTPEGSVVVYDECQKIFPSSGKAGVAEDERVRAMETHRHTGHDLVFITQAPTFVHHHIRKLVGKHIHCHRALGLQGATVYTWDGVCDAPNGYHEKKIADTERWTYPKELFQYYKSATVHTHKFKMPKKLIFIFAVCAALAAISVYMLSESSIPRVLGMTDKKENDIAPLTGDQALASPVVGEFINNNLKILDGSRVVTVSLVGCVSGKFCRCFEKEGNIIDIPETMCRDYAEGNLALPIKIEMNNQGTEPQS